MAEDFEVLAQTIATGLRREGMAVDVALDGTTAVDLLALTRYDVVVLDRDLPGVHGDEVCRRVVADRAESRVLMLTAAGTLEDRVGGLELGADDYLSKPFDFAELVARIRALGRRSAPAVAADARQRRPEPRLRAADSRCEPGGGWTLSPKEFAVLECLLAREGRVVSAEELLERVWDEAADPFTTTVKTTIRRLRAQTRRAACDRDGARGRLPHRTGMTSLIERARAIVRARRTVRARLTLLYAVMFLGSGLILLAIPAVPCTAVRPREPCPPSRASNPRLVSSSPARSIRPTCTTWSSDRSSLLPCWWWSRSCSAGCWRGGCFGRCGTITDAARDISANNLHQRLALTGLETTSSRSSGDARRPVRPPRGLVRSRSGASSRTRRTSCGRR